MGGNRIHRLIERRQGEHQCLIDNILHHPKGQADKAKRMPSDGDLLNRFKFKGTLYTPFNALVSSL